MKYELPSDVQSNNVVVEDRSHKCLFLSKQKTGFYLLFIGKGLLPVVKRHCYTSFCLYLIFLSSLCEDDKTRYKQYEVPFIPTLELKFQIFFTAYEDHPVVCRFTKNYPIYKQ